MATTTDTRSNLIGTVATTELAAGAAGGFVGSVLFGLLMQFVIPAPMLEMAIPAMYGIEGPALAAGWAIHQFHGVVLGIAYVLLVGNTGLSARAGTLPDAIPLGVAYGILTTVLLAVLVMPLWLGAMNFGGAPPFPNVAFPATLLSTVGHVMFAVPVAVAYALAAGE
ncbi:histidine kinase [Natranaeroarchaeum aerophilus]|uniref:Histidine kinase n=1 Tax=Natranaeroarchaeum aerophilus TaxID=2917711 RepID=A0AAE3FLJ2_9EURY|nr:histidine kinase [Natranaeroarchaeum aerophilus]MCL9812102.1 histidine kinase [Natranaeroarchaeum aerophilus]